MTLVRPTASDVVVPVDRWLRSARLVSPSSLILTYHAVGDPRKYGSVPTDRFRRDLAYVTERFEAVDLVDLVDSVRTGTAGRRVAITFDDGYHDFYSNALPVLREFDVPATVFVCPGFIDDERDDRLHRLFTSPDAGQILASDAAASLPADGDPLMLTDRQIRALVDDDLVAIGNHTMTHPDLGRISDESVLRREIEASKNELEDRFGVVVDRFSYPYGRISESSVRIAAESHELAVTTRPGRVRPRLNPYRLPRVTAHTPPEQLNVDLTDLRWTVTDLASGVVDVAAEMAGRLGYGPRSS